MQPAERGPTIILRGNNPQDRMSALGQKRTSGRLFDHFVGELQETHGHVQTQSLGGLEIDDQRYFDRHLDWKVPWLLALEDAVNVICCLGILFGEIRPVRNQAA